MHDAFSSRALLIKEKKNDFLKMKFKIQIKIFQLQK